MAPQRRFQTVDALLGAVVVIASACVVALAVMAVRGAESGDVAGTAPTSATSFTLELSADGQSIHLQGPIDFGVTRQLAALLERANGVRHISLESEGGRVAEARGLVKLIERFELATSARGNCSSACALVFISGHERSLEPGARLGFHSYGLLSPMVGMFLDPATEQKRDMAVFRRKNVDSAFVGRINATPYESMWFPTPDELLAAGVVNRVRSP